MLGGHTVRQVVRLSSGGEAVRIRISNETGRAPLVVGDARLAMPGDAPGSIDPATDRPLTFGGKRSVTVAPGTAALSDPVRAAVNALESVDVSLFIAREAGPAVHPVGLATAFLAAGDATGARLVDARTSSARFVLTEVDVGAADAGTVVAFGDSITDGYGSSSNANRRWPDALAERLAAAHARLGVVDAGIAGNRVLTMSQARYGIPALARLDRDVLSVPNVRTMILLEGINDIGGDRATAGELIAGLEEIVARAHARGVRVLGGTLTPFAGSLLPHYYSARGEAVREAVNGWIRTGGVFDGVVDFDRAVRDPGHPGHLAEMFDCGDHLHPNDAGYRRMAEAIDLRLLIKGSGA